jgi:hypothetical protein
LIANEPVEYWDGMFDKKGTDDEDSASVRALGQLIRGHVAASGVVEVYALWNDAGDASGRHD